MMEVRCPHCHTPIQVMDDRPLSDISCASCGSTFSLLGEETLPYHAADQVREGKSLGHFVLLDQIGAGGFGTVWRARDTELDRTVVVKIPRKGQLAPAETEQFLREARAAAQLKHPNIVGIHEVGRGEDSVYIVSDYIEGFTLADRLTDQGFTSREAAGLCAKVADAVHHAHETGVIHRDLKPANIMIDSGGEPHVMDFGLARREAGEITMTMDGQIMGTPAYISPEQAKGEAHHADRRSDVYCLGVILFELLTGERPFRGNVRMLLQQVIHDDAPSPRRYNSNVPRDLETICLKCLQKEPSRRYDTAGDLADDLRRYLDGLPIRARAVGWAERTVRWCRRNPRVAALLTSTALFLILALVATLVGYVRTAAALKSAETGYRHARVTVDDFFTQVSEDTLLNQPGMQPLRRELLEQALDYYQQFLEERSDDPAISDELAMTYFRIGRITEQIDSPDKAVPSFRRALDIQKRLVAEHGDDQEHLEPLGNTYSALGGAFFKQHKVAEARRAFYEAIVIRKRLARADPRHPELQRLLANSFMNYGLVKRAMREPDEARGHFEDAQAIRRRLLEDDPGSEKVRRDLGMGCYNLANLCLSLQPRDQEGAEANFEEAARCFRELLGADPNDLDNQHRLAVCCRLLGDLKCVSGESEAGAALYQEALGRMQTLVGSNPDVPEYQSALARLLMNLGQLESDGERREPAMDFFRRALEMLEPLVARHAEVAHYRRDLAVALQKMAELEIDADQEEAARNHLLGARDHFGALLVQFPDDSGYQALLAQVLVKLGRLEGDQERHEPALDFLGHALRLLEPLVERYADPKDQAEPKQDLDRVSGYRRDLAVALREMAELEIDAGEEYAARYHLLGAQKHFGTLADQFPDETEYAKSFQETTDLLESLTSRGP